MLFKVLSFHKRWLQNFASSDQMTLKVHPPKFDHYSECKQHLGLSILNERTDIWCCCTARTAKIHDHNGKANSKQDCRCFHNWRKAVSVPQHHFPLRYIQKIIQGGKPRPWYSPTWNDSLTKVTLSGTGATCSYDLAFSARRRLTTQVKAKMRFLFRNYAGYFRVNSQPINHIWRASCMLIEKTSPISLPFLEAPLLGWHIKFFWAGENEAIPVLIVNTKCANLLPWGMYKLVIFYKTLIYTN